MQLARLQSVFLLLAVVALASTARASDDWPQFRRDSLRSGFSRDPIPVGMTEVWNWADSSRANAGFGVPVTISNRPIGTCAVWNGRLYTINRENNHPYLVCADLRTGLRIWHQRIFGWGGCRPESGPAVSQSGIVYAYGRAAGNEKQLVTRTKRIRGQFTEVTEVADFPADHISIRAFDARTGTPVANHPLPAAHPRTQFDRYITRLYLQDTRPGTLAILPGQGSSFGLFEPRGFGPPLLIGDRIHACSDRDLVVRWQPGGPAEMLRISYPYVINYLGYAQQSKLQGYPLAQVESGVLIADDVARRYLGVLGSGTRLESFSTSGDRQVGAGTAFEWFRPMDWTLGIPTVTSDRLVMGMGGPEAQSTIRALEPRTGAVRWSYPAQVAPDLTLLLDTKWYHMEWPLVGPPPVKEAGPWQTGDHIAKDFPRSYLWTADWRSTSGQVNNLGLVSTDDTVYGIARGDLVAIESGTGRLVWKRPIKPGSTVKGLVGTRDHLVLSQHNGREQPPTLMGVSRKSGKLEWISPLSGLGQLVPAYSMLMLCEDGKLSAYGPGERRFRMAVDSPRREDYEADPAQGRFVAAQDGEGDPEAKPAVLEIPESLPKEQVGLGDAALVRLRWGTPVGEMIRQAQARKRLSPDGRLLVVVDWLDPKRTQCVSPLGSRGWTRQDITAFAATCGALAKAVEPEYLEIGSEVNVYLTRRPDELEDVRALIRATRLAVRESSEKTQVLVSFNCEVQANLYGRTSYLPFGDLPDRTRESRQAIMGLAADLQVVGLSTRPQAAFIQAGQVGPQYLLARRQELGGKPVLITRLEARYDDTSVPAITQRQFLKKMFQTAYWLDALIVAYPDIRREEMHGAIADVTLATASVHRPAMSEWKAVLGWKWVEALTSQPPATERTLR